MISSWSDSFAKACPLDLMEQLQVREAETPFHLGYLAAQKCPAG